MLEVIALGILNIGVKAQIKTDNEHYEALINQYEVVMDDEQYTIAHYKLLCDIEDWNEKLAWRQTNQHDFWIRPFIPDIYDDYKYITLNMFMKAEFEEDCP